MIKNVLDYTLGELFTLDKNQKLEVMSTLIDLIEVEDNAKDIELIDTTRKYLTIKSDSKADNKIETIYYLYNIKLYDYFMINGFSPIVDKISDKKGECINKNGKPYYRYIRTLELMKCIEDWKTIII